MLKKRGQESGTGAAVLVVLITILIIAYVMFIPPADREKLLDSNYNDNTDSPRTIDDYEITNLLKSNPGKVSFIKDKEIEHDLAGINLFTKTAGTIIKEKNSIYVKRAIFTDINDNLSFTLNDPENANNLLLNFNAEKAQGLLIVKLNGNTILSKILNPGQMSPLKLPKDLLQTKNTITFLAGSVGAAFWQTNEFTLENILVTGDITDVSAQTSKLNFIVDEFEKVNLNKVKLRYYPDCTSTDVGTLRITLNDCKVFSGVPDCNQLSINEMLPYCISQGENVLEFETEKGHYLIDQIQIRSELKETRDYIYDFYLNSTQYDKIQNNEADVNISMRFADDIEEKEAKIIINGYETTLDTLDANYSSTLNIFATEGTNIVKILPQGDFYIGELKVDYLEEE